MPLLNLLNQPIVLVGLFMINITILITVLFSLLTELYFLSKSRFFLLRGCDPGDIIAGVWREYSFSLQCLLFSFLYFLCCYKEKKTVHILKIIF